MSQFYAVLGLFLVLGQVFSYHRFRPFYNEFINRKQRQIGDQFGFGFQQQSFGNGFNWDNTFQDNRQRVINPDFAFIDDDYDDDNNNNNNNNNQFNRNFNGNGIFSTQPPPPASTVQIPGMGTTRSPCEDACSITPQYNPVCGDNGMTYTNMNRLRCAQDCGKRVQLNHLGACTLIPGTPRG